MTSIDLKLDMNQIAKKLLFAFIFFVPIFMFNQMNLGNFTLRMAQEEAFQLGAIILYAIILLENIYLSMFLILSVILYVTHHFSGGEYLTNIFYACIIYQISYKIIDAKNIEQVFRVILWLCFLNLVWMILQNLSFDPLFYDLSRPSEVMKNVGFMGLKCFMGMFFVCALPFALYFSPIVGVLFLLPIGLSESSIAIIAAAVVLGIYAWWRLSKKDRIVFAILATVLIVLAGAYTANDSKANMMTNRFSLWKMVLRDACKHPVTGWGLDSFRNISSDGYKNFKYFNNESNNEAFHAIYIPEYGKLQFPKNVEGKSVAPWDNAHNEYVQLFLEFGIFSFVILLLFSRDIFRRFDINDKHVKSIFLFFIAIGIVSLAQFPFHVVRIGLLIPVMLGAYYKLTDTKENVYGT